MWQVCHNGNLSKHTSVTHTVVINVYFKSYQNLLGLRKLVASGVPCMGWWRKRWFVLFEEKFSSSLAGHSHKKQGVKAFVMVVFTEVQWVNASDSMICKIRQQVEFLASRSISAIGTGVNSQPDLSFVIQGVHLLFMRQSNLVFSSSTSLAMKIIRHFLMSNQGFGRLPFGNVLYALNLDLHTLHIPTFFCSYVLFILVACHRTGLCHFAFASEADQSMDGSIPVGIFAREWNSRVCAVVCVTLIHIPLQIFQVPHTYKLLSISTHVCSYGNSSGVAAMNAETARTNVALISMRYTITLQTHIWRLVSTWTFFVRSLLKRIWRWRSSTAHFLA